LTKSASVQKKGGNNKENSTKVCHKKKEKSSKVCVKKKGKCSKVSDNTNLCHCIRYKKFQMYLTSCFSCFCSEQQTTEVSVDDGAALQNACLSHPSLPQQEISESYTIINEFSSIFQGAMTDSVIGEF
jgi:hypothetical protein